MSPMMEEFDSTLIRRGKDATTFSEMAEFARTVHERPLATLIEELPQIARLSETKFHLAANILKNRFRAQSSSDQIELRRLGFQVANRTSALSVADRIRSIFELPLS
jgi:hypothetical protein